MSPRVALLVITDGRWDYLAKTLESARVKLGSQFCERVLVDDSADDDVSWDLTGWTVVKHDERRGLAGAIQSGWDTLADLSWDYVFHLEDDFIFPDYVNVAEMVAHIEADPTLAQVALCRQPWSPEEQALGSLYATNPDTYTEADGLVRHRRLFTFNPCVYPRWVTSVGAGIESEVTDRLLAGGASFSYLGGLDDPPRCVHIGARRSGGYRW